MPSTGTAISSDHEHGHGPGGGGPRDGRAGRRSASRTDASSAHLGAHVGCGRGGSGGERRLVDDAAVAEEHHPVGPGGEAVARG